MPDSLLVQPLSKSSLVHPLFWHPPLHTPYISSLDQSLLFAAHAHSKFSTNTRFAMTPISTLAQPLLATGFTQPLQINEFVAFYMLPNPGELVPEETFTH